MEHEMGFDNTMEQETTVFSKETKLTGDVETTENLTVHGEIHGQVKCRNLIISGIIKGNIRCENITTNGAIILGDVQATNMAEINGKTSITGDVTIANLILNGRIKGNVQASSSVAIHSSGAVVGDIATNTITVDSGSVIQGRISIDKEVYFDDEIM